MSPCAPRGKVHGLLGGYMCAVFEIVGAEILFAALSSKAHYSSQASRDRVACLFKAEIYEGWKPVEIVWRVCVKQRYEGWKPVAMIAPLRYLIHMKCVGCRAVTNNQLFN